MSSFDSLLKVSAIEPSSFNLKKESQNFQDNKKNSGKFKDILEEETKKQNVNTVQESSSYIVSENINSIRTQALLESLNATEQYLRLRIKK